MSPGEVFKNQTLHLVFKEAVLIIGKFSAHTGGHNHFVLVHEAFKGPHSYKRETEMSQREATSDFLDV